MVKHHYVFLLLICLGGFLCHFMLCVENQDSRIFGTSKQEFLRVLTEIINPPALEDPLVIPDDNDAVREEEGEDIMDTHRVDVDDPGNTEPVLTPAQLRKRKIRNAKRDSFFFLQRSLERRAAVAAGAAPSTDGLSPRSRGGGRMNRNSGIEKVA